MKTIEFEITERIAVLSDNGNGGTMELNVVSYGEFKPKLDVRRWRNGQPLKGITLTDDEARALLTALQKKYGKGVETE